MWSLTFELLGFFVCAGVIIFSRSRLSVYVYQIAERTAIREIIYGFNFNVLCSCNGYHDGRCCFESVTKAQKRSYGY